MNRRNDISDIPSKDLITALKELGFTEYQAKIYLALASRGPLNPTEISSIANIPRPNTYPSLDRLIERGLVLRESVGRGPRYLAVPFDQVASTLKLDIQNKLVTLEEVKKTFTTMLEESHFVGLSPSETAWLISGNEKIGITIRDLLSKAKSEIISIITPEIVHPDLQRGNSENILDIIERKVKEKVQVTMGIKVNSRIRQQINRLKKKCKIYEWTLADQPFGSYVIDGRECLLTLIGRWTPVASYDLAIWVRNPIFVKSFMYLTERLLILETATRE